MPTFGISAFLRIIHLNARPQRTEFRRRYAPREGGYDFHSSLRRFAHRMMVEGSSFEEALAATATIAKEAERNSAQQGLRRLNIWKAVNPGEILAFDQVTAQSPEGRFNVTFKPNFGLHVGGETVAIHLWNTTRPRLETRLVRAVLSLFAGLYNEVENGPDDLAVLCLRTMRLIRLQDASEVIDLGRLIMRSADQTFAEIERESGRPPAPPEDQPPAPPPAE